MGIVHVRIRIVGVVEILPPILGVVTIIVDYFAVGVFLIILVPAAVQIENRNLG